MTDFEFIQRAHELSASTARASDFQPYFWAMIAFNLFAIALIRANSSIYISSLFKTGIYTRLLIPVTQEDIRLHKPRGIILTIAYFFAVGILVSRIIQHTPELFGLAIALILFAVFKLKLIFMASVRVMSQSQFGVKEHMLYHLIYYQIGAIVLTPALLISEYLPADIQFIINYILIGFIGFIILLREFQTIIHAIKNRIAPIYIILYLCTLEILPLAIIIRVLLSDNY